MTKKYDGRSDSHDHLAKWIDGYGEEPQLDWVDLFYHTLDVLPMNWYLEIELHHGMEKWDILRQGFFMTFTFEDEFEYTGEAL